MAARRSPARDKAYQLWLDTDGKRPLTQIAADCGVSSGLVRKWKSIDHWMPERKKKSAAGVTDDGAADGNGNETVTPGKRKPGAPYGNCNNPKGNPHFKPLKKGDKIALRTGIDESILFPQMNDTERLLAAEAADLSPAQNALRTLMIMTVRERRIMERIDARIRMASEACRISGDPMCASRAVNTKNGATRAQTVEYENVVSFVTELEDALTRVQGKKISALELLHRIQRDTAMAEIERRKINAVEEKLGMERKKLEYETNGAALEAPSDQIAAWIEMTTPSADNVTAIFKEEPDENAK